MVKINKERDQNKAILGLCLLLIICGILYFYAPYLGTKINIPDEATLVFAPSDSNNAEIPPSSPQNPTLSPQTPPETPPPTSPNLHLEIANYADLGGWQTTNMAAALTAFNRSCALFLERDPETKMGGTGFAGIVGDWQDVCRKSQEIPIENNEIRQFFEQEFTPYTISDHAQYEGLFTGYYVPNLAASPTYHPQNYPYPLYARPDDLIMINLGDFREELRGQRIAGRAQNGMLIPYHSRPDIEPAQNEISALNNRGLELYYAANKIDVFFLQIQGSGRLTLPDNSTIMLGYDGQNGHPYYAIGRALIENGEIARADMSMQAIRNWLETHPEESANIMNLNASYVFFRELPEGEALGAQGIGLTPEASLAVDLSFFPLGIPLWLDATHPDENMPQLQQLMITQDTGGAIRGVVRGDVFWGYGAEAIENAGKMSSQGRLWALLPNNIEPAQLQLEASNP